MLEDIVKHLKPNNNESMYDDDVMLEGFPIDTLDKLFSRKLVNILELTLLYNL